MDQGKNGVFKKYFYDRIIKGARETKGIKQEAQAVMQKAFDGISWDKKKKLTDGFAGAEAKKSFPAGW